VFTTTGKNPINGMMRINTLAHFLRQLKRFSLFVVGVTLLSLTFPILAAQESEEVADHIIAAEEALKTNQYQTAAAEYRLAAELSDDVEVARTATQVAYSYGFNDDAVRSAERWVELEPDSDEALLYVAQLYLRTGEIRDSRRSFEKLLEKGEQPVDESLLRLIPVLAREDADNAFELMRQLARPYKDSPFAHYAVAVLALQAGETETASERAREAIEIDPEWVKPHLVYARSLLLAGDEEGAIDYTSRLVGDDPDPDPEARLELAIMLVSAGRDDDALSQVNQILLEQPYRTDALRLMAIINFRLDNLDVARADFEDLLASGNYRMDALYYLGRIEDRRGNFEEALEYYAQVTGGSNAVASQSRAAGIIAEQGAPQKALEHLDRFAEINPNYAVDILRTKAQILVSIDRHDEALEIFDQAIAYRPNDEGLQLSRAELTLRMGRVDDAIDQYRKAVKRWPESAMSINALGYTLADRTDRYDEAARLIKKALKMAPNSAAIIDSWGWVLHKQGKNEEALGYLEDAYEKLRDPEVAGHIVEVLMAMDRQEDAWQTLEEAELLFPESDYLEKLREQIGPEAP
jgi:tetratricopeptide (TPR) repeat protein